MEKVPELNNITGQRMLKWSLLVLLVVSAAGSIAFSNLIETEGWVDVSVKLQILRAVIFGVSALFAGFTFYVWLDRANRTVGWLQGLFLALSRLRWGLLLPMAALAAAFPILMVGRLGVFLAYNWIQLAVFVWLVVLMAVCIMALWQKSWIESLFFSALTMAVVYHLGTNFPAVSNYPFSLGWSEASRYYLASNYFAEQIYGQDLPWVTMHLTRYLIQAFPFLIPDSPIWLHRLWQVILSFTTPYITGYLMARYFKISNPKVLGVFVAWAGLYFFQGPVFYHLIVMVMLAFIFFDVNRFWRTLLVVALISIYAGFSRINWVPMAGLMAAVLYFMDAPVPSGGWRSVARYLLPPASWVLVGTAVGLAAQQFWVVNSGNPEDFYYSSFTSYLIWQRLFPNPSYPMGILPHILLVTGPLLVYLGMVFFSWRKRVHWLRWLALAGITGMLFVGGLIVSIKIGGGTNLHNMDVYLVMVLLIAAVVYFGRMHDQGRQIVRIRIPFWLKAAVLVMPVLFAASFVVRTEARLDPQAAQDNLAQLQQYVDEAVAEGREVLFISQRHLITFGLIKNVPLVHEYEKVLLMEMVMARNEVYLNNLGAELEGQRFALIVIDRLPRFWRDPTNVSLAMENNVVLSNLVPLFTCAYEKQDVLLKGSLYILVPKADVTCGLD
jgi:hypothetical protein